jgi:hypothetical protein
MYGALYQEVLYRFFVMSLDRGTRKHLAIFVGVFNKAVELTVQHLRDPEQELPTFAVSYIT